jgi:hypothetical protein
MAMNPEQIRRALEQAGTTLDTEVARSIADLGDAAVPELLEVLLDPKLQDGEGTDCEAPVHAARLLGVLRPVRAIGPMLGLLAELAPDDPLAAAVSMALQDFGLAARDAVLQALVREKDADVKAAFADVLAGLGAQDPAVREALLDFFSEDPGFGATCLAGYGDASVLPDLLAAFDAHEIVDDWDFDDPRFPTAVVLDVGEAVLALGGELGPTRTFKLGEARRVRDAIWKEMGWHLDENGFPIEDVAPK